MPPLIVRFGAACLLAVCPFIATSAHAQFTGGAGYHVTNLVADVHGRAGATDPHLVNPWGMAFFPDGAFWINDNGTGVATLYNGKGTVFPPVFKVPAPTGQAGPSAPTGIVINTTFGFHVPHTTLPAAFIFATEDGTISAWAGGLPTNPMDAVLAVNNSGSGAVYKGLELGVTAAGAFLYATNFRSGAIDVFDETFAPADAKLLGSFKDPQIQPGYAPFGIRNIDGNLFVTYARQNAEKHDDAAGPGHGYVDVFDTDGRLLQHFAAGGLLNSPWGIARAPAGFGPLSNLILIGNFGDGQINAFDANGRQRALLEDVNGRPIAIGGLWGLSFGGAAGSTPRTLYFTAGSNHEQHGLFGTITPTTAPAAADVTH